MIYSNDYIYNPKEALAAIEGAFASKVRVEKVIHKDAKVRTRTHAYESSIIY